MAGRQAEAKHELTALFSREIGQKDKAQLVRAMYIETTETKYLLLLKPCTTHALPANANGPDQRLRACSFVENDELISPFTFDCANTDQ